MDCNLSDVEKKGMDMDATIVAINRQLGAMVAETSDHTCVIIETLGRITATVGDKVRANWSKTGKTQVDNLTQGLQMQATLQAINISRNEAIGRMTIL